MKRFLLFPLLACVLIYGCVDALNMIPENSVTFSNALETENDMEASVRLVAQKVRDIGHGTAYGNDELGLYADSVRSLESRYRRDLNPRQVRKADWFQWYEVIASANVVTHFVEQIDATRERKDYYWGQGCFYKAYAYFMLAQKWGDCVIIGDEVSMEGKAKSTWTEVVDYAINLAREAVRLLPEYDKIVDSRGASPKYKNEPCKGAANALLAHLCAWKAGGKYFAQPNQRGYDEEALWREAEQACTAIIGSETGEPAGIYRLVSTPEEVCTSVLRGNSVEGIFEMQYSPFWDEIGENKMSDRYTTWADARALNYHGWIYRQTLGEGLSSVKDNSFLIRATTAKEMFPKGDLRREAYFWKLDSMSHDTLLPTTGGFAYPWGIRYTLTLTSGDNKGQFDHFDCNSILWRLADIYLLRAECRARLGKTQEAIADLNTIRHRANAKLYDASEYDGDLRFAIFKEREKELLYEGQRFFDVVRNGYLRRPGILSTGFMNASDQDFIDGCFFVALDNTCFGRNTLLRQNTWWHKYL